MKTFSTKIGLSIFSLAKALAEAGMTPLAYMLNVMRDPKVGSKRRDEKQRRTYGTANDLPHPPLEAQCVTCGEYPWGVPEEGT